MYIWINSLDSTYHYFWVLWLFILYRLIGLLSIVFANGPGDLGSIPGHVIPKTLKIVLDTSLLNTQQYKVRIKGKVEQSREGVAPSPTPGCSSYWKGNLLVTNFTYYFFLPNKGDCIIWNDINCRLSLRCISLRCISLKRMFDSHWVPHSCGLVLHLSKKLSKLRAPLVV